MNRDGQQPAVDRALLVRLVTEQRIRVALERRGMTAEPSKTEE